MRKKSLISLNCVTASSLPMLLITKVDNTTKINNTIREVIGTLSKMTGKNISKEKEDRIIETILKDKVPKSIDKMF